MELLQRVSSPTFTQCSLSLSLPGNAREKEDDASEEMEEEDEQEQKEEASRAVVLRLAVSAQRLSQITVATV